MESGQEEEAHEPWGVDQTKTNSSVVRTLANQQPIMATGVDIRHPISFRCLCFGLSLGRVRLRRNTCGPIAEPSCSWSPSPPTSSTQKSLTGLFCSVLFDKIEWKTLNAWDYPNESNKIEFCSKREHRMKKWIWLSFVWNIWMNEYICIRTL